ncbi:translation initiation factor eIF3 subunit g [Tulasnella sp. JGI-2019a]|nr:translation initiation factor eIF3 subunit g [Tulasnella sp. JGI-2019a]
MTTWPPAIPNGLEALTRVFTDSIKEAMRVESGKPVVLGRQLRTRQADRFIELIGTIGETFQRNIAHHIVQCRRRRNVQLAIYQLPVELIVKIFSLSLQDRSMTDRVRWLHNLAQVSTRWLELIKDSASLWSVVSVSEMQSLCIALRKSKNAPLDVEFDGSLIGWNPQDRRDFLEAILGQRHRWRSIQLSGPTTKFERAMILEQVPKLVDLGIAPGLLVWEDGQGAETSIPEEVLGGLQHLSLSEVSLQWNPSVLSGLKTLKLEDLMERGRPTLSTLIAILQASPSLEELRITGKSVEVSPIEDTTTVDLPCLTTISLLKSQPEIAQPILERLRIPQCTKFLLDVVSGLPTDTSKTDMTHIENCLRRIIASHGKVEVTVSPERISLATRINATDIPVLLFTPLSLPWVDHLLESIVCPLSIAHIIHGWNCVTEQCPIPRNTSDISSLAITSSQTDAVAWIQRLSEPVSNGEEVYWQLPSLKRLTLNECRSFGEPLLTMIQRRNGWSGGEHGGVKVAGEDEISEDEAGKHGDGEDDKHEHNEADIHAGRRRAGADASNRAGETMGRGPGSMSRDDMPTLRVSNVSEDAEEDDMRNLFGRFGKVTTVYVGKGRGTGIGRRYAFVSFEDKASAEKALEKVHGSGYDNLILNVQWSHKPTLTLERAEVVDPGEAQRSKGDEEPTPLVTFPRHLPASLESLSLLGHSDVDYSIYIQLEKIIGRARITWDDPDDVAEADQNEDNVDYFDDGYDDGYNDSSDDLFEYPV